MKKVWLILFCIIFCGLAGCSSNKNNANVHTDYDWLPTTKNKNEILLYDKYDQRIVAYNKKSYNITEKNTTQNYMQFEFSDLMANIYTTGHSIENNYKIIEKENKTIKTLYEMKENEAIFPLAYQNENNMYFLKTAYNPDGNEIYEERVICQFELESKQLKEIKSTQGLLVSNGVIVDDILYFTVYNETNDNYDLYSLNINNIDKVDLINKGLVTGEVYNNNGKLWVSDKNNLYDYEDNSIQFPKKILNYFYLDKLFQIDINNEGDLELTITNITTKNTENTFDKIVDVRAENNKIYIYTLDEMTELN